MPLYSVTVEIQNPEEAALFLEFAGKLEMERDPFAKPATAIVNKLDAFLDADEPPAAHSGPTWAPAPLVVDDSPTEAEAVAAFQQFAKSHDAAACVALVSRSTSRGSRSSRRSSASGLLQRRPVQSEFR